MWTSLFSLENIFEVLRCFHSDTGLALLRWIKVAVKLSGTLPLKKITKPNKGVPNFILLELQQNFFLDAGTVG